MKSGRMWKHYIKSGFFNCRYSHSSKPPQHRCPSCNFGAKTKSALKSHLLVHDEDAHLTCQHCSSFACKRSSELKRHLRLKHGGSKSESILKCPGKKMLIKIIFFGFIDSEVIFCNTYLIGNPFLITHLKEEKLVFQYLGCLWPFGILQI